MGLVPEVLSLRRHGVPSELLPPQVWAPLWGKSLEDGPWPVPPASIGAVPCPLPEMFGFIFNFKTFY